MQRLSTKRGEKVQIWVFCLVKKGEGVQGGLLGIRSEFWSCVGLRKAPFVVFG
jgi:hypothetical protein